MSEGTPKAIELRDVSFRYVGVEGPVLRDITWSVDEGEFVVVTGNSGSGKSTLLRCLKPEIAPAGELSGEIAIGGALLSEETSQLVGFVAQNPMSQTVCDEVSDELAFGMENRGADPHEIRRRMAEVSLYFGLEPLLHKKTNELSGGELQLVALSSVLICTPHILLLDEPTSELDPVAAHNFCHALFRLNRELGMTIVIATHQSELYRSYATSWAHLDEGELRVPSCGPQLDVGKLSEFSFDEERLDMERLAKPPHGGAQNTPRSRSNDHGGLERSPRGIGSQRACNVVARDLWFRYGKGAPWVLRGLDAQFDEGSITALMGGNGCGKTTFLQMVAGILKPQHGKVKNALQTQQAYLPQSPQALFTADRVDDELCEWMGDGLHGQKASSRVRRNTLRGQRDTFPQREEINEILRRFGLENLRARHPYDLSGGQMQLLALAKVLLRRPQLLLLDEPTHSLDSPSRERLAELLHEERKHGCTIVMATHDGEFARAVSDHVALLFDGSFACMQETEEYFASTFLTVEKSR